jgi:hypothetical protein
MKEPEVGTRTARAMFVRPFRAWVAMASVALAGFFPTAALAGRHHAESIGASRAPAITFTLGRHSSPISTSLRLRDFSHIHETIKPLELAPPQPPTPKAEPTFPSFSNPLHRHRMAMIAF